jgi:chaperone modulatory protein CbpM
MIDFDALLLHIAGLEPAELRHWIEKRWLLPERRQEIYLFHEVDVARAELIFEIRREFALDEEALDLVLSLLDQLYEVRRTMRCLCDALAGQPAEVQEAVGRALAASRREPQRD